MNVFLSAVQSCILREKNPNPNLLRNHLRHEMQRKINDRNEYSAVSQTEDRAWFSCTKMQAQMCTRGLWDPPSARWVHNTPVTSLSAECARHCQRAGEALACVACTLSSYLQDRFSLFPFGQVHPSLLEMKIILQTSLVFPPLIAENCLFQERRIMKCYFLWRKQSHTSEFSAWIIICIPHLLHSESSLWALANWTAIKKKETGVISAVLEITGNTASLQEF